MGLLTSRAPPSDKRQKNTSSGRERFASWGKRAPTPIPVLRIPAERSTSGPDELVYFSRAPGDLLRLEREMLPSGDGFRTTKCPSRLIPA